MSSAARLVCVLIMTAMASCDVRLRDEYVDSSLIDPTDRPKAVERDALGDPILPRDQRIQHR
jgi:hypothetical protein